MSHLLLKVYVTLTVEGVCCVSCYSHCYTSYHQLLSSRWHTAASPVDPWPTVIPHQSAASSTDVTPTIKTAISKRNFVIHNNVIKALYAQIGEL